MPKVSIIIPVYNKQLYLESTFKSVLEQEFQNFEVIAVNDGSKDHSLDILNSLAARDCRIRVIDIPNGGVSHARNVGIDAAKGEYLTFIDADDYVDSHYLSNLYSKITASQADIVISGYQKFWPDNRQNICIHLPYADGTYEINSLLSDFAQIQSETGAYGCCTAKILRRDFLSNLRFDESLRLAEDFDFYLNLYEKAKQIYVDSSSYYFYRQDAENASTSGSDYNCDYEAQLRILLHERQFLHHFSMYHGNNQKILEEKLTDYLFFSVFYCSTEKMNAAFPALYLIMLQEHISTNSTSHRKALILSLFSKKHFLTLRIVLNSYRMLHKYLKGEP